MLWGNLRKNGGPHTLGGKDTVPPTLPAQVPKGSFLACRVLSSGKGACDSLPHH